MPRSWSDKRERQYEHIKESYKEDGASNDEAEERAARTVNKERAEHGETKSSRKRGPRSATRYRARSTDRRTSSAMPVSPRMRVSSSP
jgi:plasmid stabilization system protein ParE